MTEATGTVGSIQPPIGRVGHNYGFSVGKRNTGDSTVDSEQDKDMFLKLLVAQMRYQDPTKPTDTTAFLAQTAQFTLVEKMSELQSSQEAMASASGLQAATALVGRTVTYSTTDATGATVTRSGMVSGFSVSAGVPTLTVGTDEVELSDVTKVTQGAPATPTAPTTPAPTPSPVTGTSTGTSTGTTPATGV